MSGVATAGRREGSTCARCGRPARLAAITNTIGAPTLKRGDVASGMCRCPVVDVSINAGGVAAVLHVTSPRASDEDSDIHGTSRVRAHGPPTPTKATSSPHGKKRRAEDALDVEEVNAAVTPRKKAKLDNTTSHLSPYQGTQLSVKSPRHILTSHASVKSPRSPRARPSTPRTPATSRAKPKPKTTTPRTELTAAVPLDLQPLGRHNDQRTSMPTSSTFTVRSPTYGSRALLGPTSLGALLDAAKSSPTPSSSVLSASSAWRESSRSPSTSSRSPVLSSRSALGSPGAASSSTATTQGILRRGSPGHLGGRLDGQSLSSAAFALGLSGVRRALVDREMAVLNWCKRRNAIEMQVGEITRDMWRGRSANGQIRYRNLVTGATRDDLPQLSRGAIVQPQVGVNNTVVMCEFLASEMAPADLALIVAPPTSREKWKTCSAAHPKLVPAVDPALKTGPNALGGINVVIIGSDDLVPALAGRSAIGTLSWAYLIVDGGDFLADPRQGMNVNAVTRLKAASRWALPAETMRLTKTSVPAICAALKLCPDLYDACSERHLAHLEREIAPTEIPR